MVRQVSLALVIWKVVPRDWSEVAGDRDRGGKASEGWAGNLNANAIPLRNHKKLKQIRAAKGKELG